MDFRDYQEAAIGTAIYPAYTQVVYPAMGLANEAGEVLGKLKKGLRDGGLYLAEEDDLEADMVWPAELSRELRQAVSDELGDVLWYIAALARDCGLDMDEIAQANISKLKSRQERGALKGSGDDR